MATPSSGPPPLQNDHWHGGLREADSVQPPEEAGLQAREPRGGRVHPGTLC